MVGVHDHFIALKGILAEGDLRLVCLMRSCAYLEEFTLVVASVESAARVVAMIRKELAAIDGERCQGERSIAGLRVGSVLPLHYTAGACGIAGCFKSVFDLRDRTTKLSRR